MNIGARPSPDWNGAAQKRFETCARALGFDPGHRWVGGYADYEWDHLRVALDAYGVEVADRDVLELGCNVGGSSVVLAALGARLSGVDIDTAFLPVAQANLDRHGLPGVILPVAPDGRLPFDDGAFDLVVANSVLEYIDPELFDRALDEIHRVLRPGGRLFICGTASRLAWRERHSGKALVNFIPRGLDSLTGRPLQRGLAPGRLAAALRGRFRDISGLGWLPTREAIHDGASLPIRAYALLGRLIGRTPGWFAPHIELLLERS